LRRRGWTDSAKGAVVEVINGEVDPKARDDARKGIGDSDPQLGVLNQVERFRILCDRGLDGFEYLVYAASVGVQLAHRSLEGRVAPDRAQGTLRLPETQLGGDGLTGGDRLVRDGRVLIEQASKAGQGLGSRGPAGDGASTPRHPPATGELLK